MKIESADLERLEKFGDGSSFNRGGFIYKYNDDILYKIIGLYLEEAERNVDLQIKDHISHTPYIYDKLYMKRDFVGYSMEYLKNCFTFRKGIYLHIDYDDCIKIIHVIYSVIKYLHGKNILVGDIHMDNFLIDGNNNGYVIDLDYLIFPGEEIKFDDLYSVKLKSNGFRQAASSKKTDNIKAMICCLSLILGVDLESYVSKFELDIENIYNTLIKEMGNRELDDYFQRVMNGENVEYFDDFLDNGKVLVRKK